jgi:predicted phage terminase large subunit-like protein
MMTLAAAHERVVLEETIAAAKARKGLLAFCTYVMPEFECNWHHRAIARAVNYMARGKTHRQLLHAYGMNDKAIEQQLLKPHSVTKLYAGMTSPGMLDKPLRSLQVHVPPRNGKSQIISRCMPAWWLGHSPNAQIIATSYSADLASSMNRDVQRIIDSSAYGELFPKSKLWSKNIRTVGSGSWLRNSDIFEIVGHKGVYRSAGVGGGITGRGATCLTGDTRVWATTGWRRIDTIACDSATMVYAFNHATSRIEPCRVKAVRRKRATRILQICVSGGRKIRATPEHLFYTANRGYRPAQSLRIGECLVAVETAQKRPMQHVRLRDKQLRRELSAMLFRHPKNGLHTALRGVSDKLRAALVRISESFAKRTQELLLQLGLRDAKLERATAGTFDMCGVRQETTQGQQILRQSLPYKSAACRADLSEGMLLLRQAVCDLAQATKSLLAQMREQRTRTRNFREKQPDLLAWEAAGVIRPNIQADAQVDHSTRQQPMRDMHRASSGDTGTCPPHRSQSKKQQPAQSDHVVREMPFVGSQVSFARIEAIEEISEDEHWVYDIEVEKCHNFFAEGILTHNCALLDDVIKNRKEADSPTVRQAIWEWYVSTLYTRLQKNACKIVINTRWHEADISGRTIQAAQVDDMADQWFCLIFPAILDAEPTPGDIRAQGEALWPNHFPVSWLETTKQTVGSYDWEALYQQRPAPREGGVIKSHWWKFYNALPEGLSQWTMSADLTYGDSKSGTEDYVVIQMWAAKGAERFLVDQMRGRMGFTEQMRAVTTMSKKYPQCRTKLIEDAANGRALVNVLKKEISGIIAVRALGSKQARLEAVTPAIEAGQVHLPSPYIAPWVDGLLHEVNTFPNAAHDDQVDAMSMALGRMAQKRVILGGAPDGITRASPWLGLG